MYTTNINLIMDYVVSNVVVSYSFTSYFNSTIGFKNVDKRV